MEQLSTPPHQQRSYAWFDRPMLALFLPYSVQTVPFASDTAAVRLIFEANRERWRQVAGQALFMGVRRRYEVVSSGEHIRINGPYGNKAWTMTTLVTPAGDEHGMLLTLRTFPHRRIVLSFLAQLIFISICSIIVGVPGAPWFPLIIFVPFLYVATVIATKVEATRLATLVCQAVEQASIEEDA
jgi:hypothetical protein